VEGSPLALTPVTARASQRRWASDSRDSNAGGAVVPAFDEVEDGQARLHLELGILTPNMTTPYTIGFASLLRTGLLVIDYPPGLSAGGVPS